MMAGTGTTSKLKGARKERKEGFDDDVDAAVAAPAVEPTTTTNQAPRRFIGTAAFEFSAEEGELSLKKDDKVIVFPDLVSPAGWWVATTNFTDTFTLQDIGLVPCDFLADPIMPASAEDAVPAVKLEAVTKGTMWARVLYDFKSEFDHELSVKPGQMLQVHPASLAPMGWALVDRPPDRGIVPPKFFLILPEKQQALQEKAVADSKASGAPMPAPIEADPAYYGVGSTGRNVLMAVFILCLAMVFGFMYRATKANQLPPHLIPIGSAMDGFKLRPEFTEGLETLKQKAQAVAQAAQARATE